MPPEITCRPLDAFDEYRECVEIQHETWGEESPDHVPASLLSVAAEVGGVAAGAFTGAGGRRMVGFVFGLAGRRGESPIHWSHMLAVRRSHRNRGIGRRLKLLQRELLLEDGVPTVFWTYDPLVARNAHFNLNLLGARVDEFVIDRYGTGRDSPLHVGGSTDRFVVRWDLESDRVRRISETEAGGAGDAGVTGDAAGAEAPAAPPGPVVDPLAADGPGDYPDRGVVRLAIPADAVAVDADHPERGRAWREGVRRALLHYLGREYRITGFLPARTEGRSCYVLRRT